MPLAFALFCDELVLALRAAPPATGIRDWLDENVCASFQDEYISDARVRRRTA